MDLDTIRNLADTRPFKPFNLVLDDGRKLLVDNPTCIAISPDGKRMAHASFDGGIVQIEPVRITSIDLDVDKRRVRAAKLTG
jgi:hypothetical protein